MKNAEVGALLAEEFEGIEFETVATDLRFPEGPIALDDGSVLLVEIERGTLSKVQADGSVSVVAALGGGPNGAAIGPDGRCYVCNNGGFEWHGTSSKLIPGDQSNVYTGGTIQVVDLADGTFETLYEACDGRSLKGPNDLIFDSAGGFWFTDHGKTRARERDVTGVFYAAADGSSLREAIFPLDAPNGIALSPDGSRLYVAETLCGRVWYWNLAGPGVIEPHPRSPHGGYLLHGLGGLQMLDSLAVDEAGRVCVATLIRGGISIFTADGCGVTHVPTGDPLTTNICFGGEDRRTAYVTLSSSGRLVKARWPCPGLALEFS